MNSDVIVARVVKWITDIVVGLNFCPFASKPLKSNLILYHVEPASTLKSALESFISVCNKLDEDQEKDTAIIILSNGFSSFDEYLKLLDLCEQLLQKEGYEGIYQVASFHPDYIFQGSNEEDPSNYTNRSPYPLLHILREEQLEKVLLKYPNPEHIPEHNIALTQKLGLSYLKGLLNAC